MSIALSLSDCSGPKKGSSILVRVAKLLRLSIFIAMFLNIVQSNLHSIYNSALTVIFTPVLQNKEK